MYSVCVHAPVYVRMCVMYCTCPYSSQLQKKSSCLNSHEPGLPKLLSDKCGAAHFPSHTNRMQRPRAVYASTCGVSAATTQANLSADGDSLSGFIGSVNLPRARSLSLYVNSSAFCPAPLWILISMWTHCVAEWGKAQQRRTILGVDVVG